jgi:hypothetical protein
VFHVSVRHHGKLFFARRFGPFEDGDDRNTHAGRKHAGGHWLQLSAEGAQPEGVVTTTAEDLELHSGWSPPHNFSTHVLAERLRDGALATLMDRYYSEACFFRDAFGTWVDGWQKALEDGRGTCDTLQFNSETDLYDGVDRGEMDYFKARLYLFVQAQDAADGAADAAPLYFNDETRHHADVVEPHMRARPTVLRRTGGAAVLSFDQYDSETGCEKLCRTLDLLHWEPRSC